MRAGSLGTPRRTIAWRASLALGCCVLLAACGDSDQPPPSFAAPDYSYLPKLRLSVGEIRIDDHAAQGAPANDLGPTAPVPPDQALRQMATDRLVAAGNSGSGVFTIDQASITGSGGGALDGKLAVHLDIIASNGGHAGYAEAHVSRQFVPGSSGGDAGSRAQLYTLTQQMMQDMNVELEFQVRRSLRDWLVDASGAPLSGAVEQQSLPPPGSTAPSLGAPVGTTPPGAPVGTTPPGAPVGTTPPGAPVGTTPVGSTPIEAAPPGSGPVTLAPPPAPLPASVPPASVPPAGAPDAVFPDGSAAPAAPQLRSPPPAFLQPPAGANGY